MLNGDIPLDFEKNLTFIYSSQMMMQNTRTLHLKSLKRIILTSPNTNKIIALVPNPHRGAQCQIISISFSESTV